MKKNLLVGIFAAAAFMVACEPQTDLPSGDEGEAKLEVAQTAFEAAAEGDTLVVSFTASEAWTASVSDGADYVLVEPASGEGSAEAQSLTIVVFANTDTTARAAAIVVAMGELTQTVNVEQAAAVAEEPAAPVVVSVADILALETDAVIENGLVEVVVISSRELGNLTSKKGMYVQDATGGLQLRFAADHEYNFGDKLQIDLSGLKKTLYNEAIQISLTAETPVEKLAENVEVVAKEVSIADFLANKYEGQYVALSDVQVAWSDLEKTFVVGDAHTSINMEAKTGETFVVFSSKYAANKGETVPQGSGVLKGISTKNFDTIQIILTSTADYAGLTGERFGESPVVQPLDTIKVSVVDFLAAPVNADQYYELTGTISNIKDAVYGNFDLTDETGTVYVYGLTATKLATGAKNDKSFASLGLQEGDIVTLYGTRADYKGAAQVGGPAYYKSHKTPLPSIDGKQCLYATGMGTDYIWDFGKHTPGMIVMGMSMMNAEGGMDYYAGYPMFGYEVVPTDATSGKVVLYPDMDYDGLPDGVAAGEFAYQNLTETSVELNGQYLVGSNTFLTCSLIDVTLQEMEM